MENTSHIENIPKEKFGFVSPADFVHDKKLATKPHSYMYDAFRRFAKNKGAIVGAVVILCLVLFAIIAPFLTQYTVAYSDIYFSKTRPRNKWFANTSFWDGCEAKENDAETFNYYYAMGLETGHNAVKDQKYEINKNGLYEYRLDSYQQNGVRDYKALKDEEYEALQRYQDEYNVQVIYPMVRKKDRPEAEQDRDNANYYYRTEFKKGKTHIVLDKDGKIIPVYQKRLVTAKSSDNYTSKMRIEGKDGFKGEDGKTYCYVYARPTQTGYECRINYYEYYRYYHTQVLKDGIKEPDFLFGTTGEGKDILTCLSSGARFSFLFAICVASVNLLVGAIYGAISGYYGGKTDLIMERITDVLSAVPTMIVITLLKLHMGNTNQAIILFLAFFLTGWIGMASTTRMQFYRFKNQEYVLAARTLGAKDARLIVKHIFPNALGTIVTGCALVIPSMIYSETNLTYLGIINLSSGNITSVGTLIAAGQAALGTQPFIALFPSVFLALLMLSFNMFGNGLRDAFNPSLRGSEG